MLGRWSGGAYCQVIARPAVACSQQSMTLLSTPPVSGARKRLVHGLRPTSLPRIGFTLLLDRGEGGMLVAVKSAQPAPTLKDVVSLGPPADQADLLAAHHSFLRGMAGLAAHAYPQARSNVPGDFVAFAVFLRLHCLAQSIQSLARAGYVREAQAIARGMVSACADLVFILEADTNARALAYALFSRRQRRRKGTAYKEIGLQKDYDRWDAQKTQEEDKLLASYKANGYEPASKLGGRDDTWTGLGS